MGGYIHWHEGLFMQPHHLQMFQRQVHEQLGAERRLARAYTYGVIEMKLAADALENMMVQFDRLRVIMPGGLYVALGENAELSALDIKDAFKSGSGALVVYLGVPLWYADRANVLEASESGDKHAKRRYSVSSTETRDENTGENPQAVLVRRVNARLLLENDDRTDLEVLPLLKIARATSDEAGLPRQDPSFVPPCLVLTGSPVLRDLARDLTSQVDASRKELALQMKRGGFRIENMRGIHYEQALRLRTLNRFGARLLSRAQDPALTPFELYIEWRELLAELAALHPDTEQTPEPDYDHDNPAPAFLDINRRIRELLRGAVKPNFMQVPFASEPGAMVATLAEEHFTQPNEYFLAIKTALDPKELIPLAEDGDRFKMMAHSMIDRAIWGVKLEAERVPPLELPAQTELHYFRLKTDESARMWKAIREEKKLAVKWPDMEEADCKLALYMTVPQQEPSA